MQGGPSIPWKQKLQKELRDVDRLSFVSEEMQESIKEALQHQLQDVEKRRHDLMLEHQKVQKSRKRYIAASRTRGKYAERKCCSGGRDAEATRRC